MKVGYELLKQLRCYIKIKVKSKSSLKVKSNFCEIAAFTTGWVRINNSRFMIHESNLKKVKNHESSFYSRHKKHIFSHLVSNVFPPSYSQHDIDTT